MILETIRRYIADHSGYPAWTERPKEPPARYYIIDKSGGNCRNFIHYSLFVVQSYAETMADAAQMNERLIEIMTKGLIAENEISSVSVNSNYDYTDTDAKQYRYQAVFDIIHY